MSRDQAKQEIGVVLFRAKWSAQARYPSQAVCITQQESAFGQQGWGGTNYESSGGMGQQSWGGNNEVTTGGCRQMLQQSGTETAADIQQSYDYDVGQ